MAKNKISEMNDTPVSVRLGGIRKAKCEALCAELGVPMTTLVKWALDGLEQYYEESGGRVLLPLNFGDLKSVIQLEMERSKEE